VKYLTVVCLVLLCSALRAQTDSSAIRLLDDAGIPTDDVDAVYDYLENSPVHFDSSARYHIRSRVIGDQYASDQNGAAAFSGAPEAYRNSLWLNSSRIVAALALQKKAWEQSIADRTTGYLALRSPVRVTPGLRIDQAAVGNYSMGFGSGLLLGDLGKTNRREHASVLPIERGLRGSLSSDPFFAQFGAAATIGISDQVAATGFYSSRKLDARVTGDSILTLYEFADHRTDAEIAMKNAASLTVQGARLAAFNSDSSQIGMAGGIGVYHGSYDHYYDGTASNPFYGRSFDAASVDATVRTDIVGLQTEAAITSNDTMHRTMYVAEASYHPSQVMGVAAAYRHIPFGIVSPFGRFLGKPLATLTNPEGYYLGLDAVIVPNLLRASAYADLSSELLPISAEFARQKHDYQLALHSMSEGWNANLAIRNQRGEDVVNTDDSAIAGFSTQVLRTTTIRLDFHDSISRSLVLKARVQNVASSNDSAHSESGWFGRIGCKYVSTSSSTIATLDVGRFSTPSYRSAVWIFEQSVQGAGRFLALYGNGYYLSLGMQLHFAKWLNLSFGASEIYYDAPRIIGSGLTSRVGSSAGELAAQVDLLF
jgi:hypothetical protein